MASLHASAFMNSNRDEKEHPHPFKLPMPWPETTPADEVSDKEREELRAQLHKHSAFAQ